MCMRWMACDSLEGNRPTFYCEARNDLTAGVLATFIARREGHPVNIYTMVNKIA